jgi:hypothetical protein
MAHALGIAQQSRTDDDPPGLVQPVFLRDDQGVLYPHRMVWPAFWGWLAEDTITPIEPEEAYKVLRRVLRIRRDFRSELGGSKQAASGETFGQKLAKGLTAMAKQAPAGMAAVYVSGGRAYSVDADATDRVHTFEHAAARPYAWPLAHDVRPARDALGVRGCTECHAAAAPLFHGSVAALGPAPDAEPRTTIMHEFSGQDPKLLAAWETSFPLRTAFKWLGFAACAVVSLVLASALIAAVRGMLGRSFHG